MPPAVIQILPNTGGAYQRAPMAKYAIPATMTASQFRSLRTSKLMAPPLGPVPPEGIVPRSIPRAGRRLEGHDAGYRQSGGRPRNGGSAEETTEERAMA